MNLSDITSICFKVSKEVEGISSFRRADNLYGLTDRVIEGIEAIGDLMAEAMPIIDRYLLFVKDRLPFLHPAEKLTYYIMKEIKHRTEPVYFMDEGLKCANNSIG